MSSNTVDQRWQEIQVRVEQLVDKYLKGGLQAIEYKPRDMVYLLDMPPGNKDERPEAAG